MASVASQHPAVTASSMERFMKHVSVWMFVCTWCSECEIFPSCFPSKSLLPLGCLCQQRCTSVVWGCQHYTLFLFDRRDGRLLVLNFLAKPWRTEKVQYLCRAGKKLAGGTRARSNGPIPSDPAERSLLWASLKQRVGALKIAPGRPPLLCLTGISVSAQIIPPRWVA